MQKLELGSSGPPSSHSTSAGEDSPLESLKEPLLFKEEKPKPFIERLFTKSYLILAGLGGVLFGTHNYLMDLSVEKLDSNMRVFGLSGFAMVTYFLCYHTIQANKLQAKRGHLWSKEDSYYFVQEPFTKEWVVDWKLIRLMSLRYMCSIGGNVTSVFMFSTAMQAQISSAFIISLLSATSIVTAVVFYFMFGEKLQLKHACGMLLMIISVIFITNSQENQPVQPNNIDG